MLQLFRLLLLVMIRNLYSATVGRGQKGGGFVCDADCPNWKALGICAHSVAVAELCKKLPDYIEKFTKAKNTQPGPCALVPFDSQW